MKISEVIAKIKAYHYGKGKDGEPIDEAKTRDKVLYGDPETECSGIVVTCFASVEVIKEAAKRGANFIICHEAIFWNHGDRTAHLADNKVFLEKKKLLDDNGIVVWRDHDYIHTGIPVEGAIVDGIFYGVMMKLGWKDLLVGDKAYPVRFVFPEAVPGKEIVDHCIKAFGLTGVRLVGDIDTVVKKLIIPGHIMGRRDDEILDEIERDDYDCVIAMEITDHTLTGYIRDSVSVGRPRLIIEVGHFNVEEPGMEYMTAYLGDVLGQDIPVYFVKSSDTYSYYGSC